MDLYLKIEQYSKIDARNVYQGIARRLLETWQEWQADREKIGKNMWWLNYDWNAIYKVAHSQHITKIFTICNAFTRYAQTVAYHNRITNSLNWRLNRKNPRKDVIEFNKTFTKDKIEREKELINVIENGLQELLN